MRRRLEHLLVARPLLSSLGAVILIQRPLLILAGGATVAAHHFWRRRTVRRKRRQEIPDQQTLLARITLVGLTAGLPLALALELTQGLIRGDVADEISRVVRRSRRQGMSLALSEAGPLTRPLFSRLTLAAASGAPMAEAVADHLVEIRQERRTDALERVRRLPVTLMIPLGLLILPGFVVLFVGPIVFRSLGSMVGALP